jgi:hypothetical protein
MFDLVQSGCHVVYKDDQKERNVYLEKVYVIFMLLQKRAYINLTNAIINYKKGMNAYQASLNNNARLLILGWHKKIKGFVPSKVFKNHYFFNGPVGSWLFI